MPEFRPHKRRMSPAGKRPKNPLKILAVTVITLAAALLPYMISKSAISQGSSQTIITGQCCKPMANCVSLEACGAYCPINMCIGARDHILSYHEQGEQNIIKHISEEFTKHKLWMTETFFKENILRAMQMMTEQLSAVAYQQAMIVGTLFDAKEQLEVQRDLQELEYQAHKDYQPDRDFCAIGTNVRSMSGSDATARYNKQALDERALKRELGNRNLAAAGSVWEEKSARWKKFTQTYCDPHDNHYNIYNPDDTGLQMACGTGLPDDKNRINADINFTRTVDQRRTIEADFTKSNPGKDGEDIIALTDNLFSQDVLTRQIPYLNTTKARDVYMSLRALAAKRNVAQNSMHSIIALKTAGTADQPSDDSSNTREYMGALLKNLGVTKEEEITLMLGKNPSYFAQLETLSKRIAQNPEFYVNLYDKPANIARKSTALQALELMIEREIYNAQIRREMLISVLLSSALEPEYVRTNKELSP